MKPKSVGGLWAAGMACFAMLGAGLSAAAPACAGAVRAAAVSSAAADRIRAGVLRFGMHVSSMGTLDPHLAAGSQDRAAVDMLFNGLLRYRPGDVLHLEPDLALQMPTFEMHGGRQVWTVHLRRGVMFHPGLRTQAHELTAEDVVFSLNRAADSRQSAYAGEYAGMTFEASGRYRVRITLEQPLSPLLFFPKIANYAGGFIVSRNAVQTMGAAGFGEHPVGTGPFRLISLMPGEKLILGANAAYFRGPPALRRVELLFLPRDRDRETLLAAGEVDVVTVSGKRGWIDRMQRSPGVVIDIHGVGEVFNLYINTRVAPLDDRRIRKAIALTLDSQAFKNTVSRHLVEDTFSPIPAGLLLGGLENREVERLGLRYDRDLARARRLMADAGRTDGFQLQLISSEKRIHRRCYQVLATLLQDIGIICRVKVMPHAQMHRMIRKTMPPLVIYPAWRPSTDAYLSRFFHSAAVPETGRSPDTNFSGYTGIDRLIEDARRQINPQKQIQLWQQAQIAILSDVAAYPIMITNQGYARRTYVDYGHELRSTMALYPQFNEKTRLRPSTAVLPAPAAREERP